MTNAYDRVDPEQIPFAPSMYVLEEADQRGATGKHEPSRFGDDVWRIPRDRDDATAVTQLIRWNDVPASFVPALKGAAWSILNRETPIQLLARRNSIRRRVKGPTVVKVTRELKDFARWLAGRGVTRLDLVNEQDLWSYAEVIQGLGLSPRAKEDRAVALTRLWLPGRYLPARDRLCRPPWEVPDQPSIRDLFGPRLERGENATEPIHPDSAAALFWWSKWFIDEAGPDILMAKRERDAMVAEVRYHTKPGDSERWNRYKSTLRRDGGALPGHLYAGKLGIARRYLAARLGIGELAIKRTDDIPVALGTPLDVEITGSIEGQPWIEAIDFYDVDRLVRHLAAACLVVVSFVTGARAQEVRALERGCCHTVHRGNDKPSGYEVWGKEFKTTDADGNAIPGGQERDMPWTGIPPVPQAIATMERLHDGPLVFPQSIFYFTKNAPNDVSVPTGYANYSIDRLAAWCNATAERRDLPGHVIEPDPEGPITLSRFRRTMAWFVYRQPFGRVSLGIHFGHVSLHTTDGYGTRAFGGQRDAYRLEEALALGERLQAGVARRDAGEGVSGPAADRYLDALTVFQGKHLTRRQFVALLDNPDVLVYGNENLHLTCVYDPTLALCHPESGQMTRGEQSPDLTHCDPRCPNVVRTDSDIVGPEKEVRRLRERAEDPGTSLPRVVRYSQRAERLETIIAKHRQDRVVRKVT